MSNHYTRFEQKPNTKFQRCKRSAFHRTPPLQHCMYGLSVVVVYYLNGNTSIVYESTGPSTYEIATVIFVAPTLFKPLPFGYATNFPIFYFSYFLLLQYIFFFQLLFCWASICLTMLIIKILKIADDLVIGLSLKEN